MSLSTLRTAITAELTTELAGLSTTLGRAPNVSTHEGPFDEKTLDRCAKAAPAVVIAFDRVKTSIEGGVVSAVADTLVTCITKDIASLKRDVAGLVLVKEVMRILGPFCANVDGLEGHQAGRDFVARNFYSEKLALKGCHIWGVAYSQRLDFLPESESLDDLNRVYTIFDLAPSDGDHEAEDDHNFFDAPSVAGSDFSTAFSTAFPGGL